MFYPGCCSVTNSPVQCKQTSSTSPRRNALWLQRWIELNTPKFNPVNTPKFNPMLLCLFFFFFLMTLYFLSYSVIFSKVLDTPGRTAQIHAPDGQTLLQGDREKPHMNEWLWGKAWKNLRYKWAVRSCNQYLWHPSIWAKNKAWVHELHQGKMIFSWKVHKPLLGVN